MTDGLTTKRSCSFSRIYIAYFSVLMLLLLPSWELFRSAEFLLDNSKQNLNLFRDLFTCCELQILLVMLLAIPNWQDISHYSCLSVDTNFLISFFQAKDLYTSINLYRTWACWVCAENLWSSSKSSIVQYRLQLPTGLANFTIPCRVNELSVQYLQCRLDLGVNSTQFRILSGFMRQP
jgi:hypothetical protein